MSTGFYGRMFLPKGTLVFGTPRSQDHFYFAEDSPEDWDKNLRSTLKKAEEFNFESIFDE